jgi:hypothetical protein
MGEVGERESPNRGEVGDRPLGERGLNGGEVGDVQLGGRGAPNGGEVGEYCGESGAPLGPCPGGEVGEYAVDLGGIAVNPCLDRDPVFTGGPGDIATNRVKSRSSKLTLRRFGWFARRRGATRLAFERDAGETMLARSGVERGPVLRGVARRNEPPEVLVGRFRGGRLPPAPETIPVRSGDEGCLGASLAILIVSADQLDCVCCVRACNRLGGCRSRNAGADHLE